MYYKEFEVHILNDDGIIKAKEIAKSYNTLADKMMDIVQEGSEELTIALRKLEESCFYMKKAMAQQKNNQKGD